jgi:hypothetical protein
MLLYTCSSIAHVLLLFQTSMIPPVWPHWLRCLLHSPVGTTTYFGKTGSTHVSIISLPFFLQEPIIIDSIKFHGQTLCEVCRLGLMLNFNFDVLDDVACFKPFISLKTSQPSTSSYPFQMKWRGSDFMV